MDPVNPTLDKNFSPKISKTENIDLKKRGSPKTLYTCFSVYIHKFGPLDSLKLKKKNGETQKSKIHRQKREMYKRTW